MVYDSLLIYYNKFNTILLIKKEIINFLVNKWIYVTIHSMIVGMEDNLSEHTF